MATRLPGKSIEKKTLRIMGDQVVVCDFRLAPSGIFYCIPPDPVAGGEEHGPQFEGQDIPTVRKQVQQWLDKRIREGLKWELAIAFKAEGAPSRHWNFGYGLNLHGAEASLAYRVVFVCEFPSGTVFKVAYTEDERHGEAGTRYSEPIHGYAYHLGSTPNRLSCPHVAYDPKIEDLFQRMTGLLSDTAEALHSCHLTRQGRDASGIDVAELNRFLESCPRREDAATVCTTEGCRYEGKRVCDLGQISRPSCVSCGYPFDGEVRPWPKKESQ